MACRTKNPEVSPQPSSLCLFYYYSAHSHTRPLLLPLSLLLLHTALTVLSSHTAGTALYTLLRLPLYHVSTLSLTIFPPYFAPCRIHPQPLFPLVCRRNSHRKCSTTRLSALLANLVNLVVAFTIAACATLPNHHHHQLHSLHVCCLTRQFPSVSLITTLPVCFAAQRRVFGCNPTPSNSSLSLPGKAQRNNTQLQLSTRCICTAFVHVFPSTHLLSLSCIISVLYHCVHIYLAPTLHLSLPLSTISASTSTR